MDIRLPAAVSEHWRSRGVIRQLTEDRIADAALQASKPDSAIHLRMDDAGTAR